MKRILLSLILAGLVPTFASAQSALPIPTASGTDDRRYLSSGLHHRRPLHSAVVALHGLDFGLYDDFDKLDIDYDRRGTGGKPFRRDWGERDDLSVRGGHHPGQRRSPGVERLRGDPRTPFSPCHNFWCDIVSAFQDLWEWFVGFFAG